MKEFTLLITILFNFPNGEHQEIQIERKQMSEVDCVEEVENTMTYQSIFWVTP